MASSALYIRIDNVLNNMNRSWEWLASQIYNSKGTSLKGSYLSSLTQKMQNDVELTKSEKKYVQEMKNILNFAE
ncbi:hypothetical protein H9L19_06660 [Weissella diestrammenae]|uniref:Uncharacterized protein n=1 Tax=Weissella diestrammenae TaxID=1162633 RepID=A0A7G9T4N0_9LACO|nr:hypothetical protein [Weissella diestrammenae]MCM0582155.1 hypothetical protein [Weissella diestrammenae]QNN75055.1 hypothetical protein H9L19_06660 [Weissella diestrammenae]